MKDDFYEADLKAADVIFDMMPEVPGDYQSLYSKRKGIRKGTKLIKHDLPLIGFLPDKIEQPFYMMQFPLRKASSQNQWAQAVMEDPDVTAGDLWRELGYYQYEKYYSRDEIRDFQSMLTRRIER